MEYRETGVRFPGGHYSLLYLVYGCPSEWVVGGKLQWSELYECNGEHITRKGLFRKREIGRDMVYRTTGSAIWG
jgi:hypothetical protein